METENIVVAIMVVLGITGLLGLLGGFVTKK